MPESRILDARHTITVDLRWSDTRVRNEAGEPFRPTEAAVTLDRTARPVEVELTGEGPNAGAYYDRARLADLDRLNGIVRVAIQEAARAVGPRNSPDALLGHCVTIGWEKAGYVLQPPAAGGTRGRVWLHQPQDAPPEWYMVAALRREGDRLFITTTCGHRVEVGERDYVTYVY